MSEPRNPDDDPFENLVLDEAFIEAAAKHEPSGEDRALSAARARQAWMTEQESRQQAKRRQVRRNRRRRASKVIATLGALAVAAFVLVGLPATEGDPAAAGEDHGGHIHLANELALDSELPSPPRDLSSTPLGEPSEQYAHLDDRGGPYLFIATQEDSGRPVAYDPCRPIRIVVNTRTQPPGGRALLDEAVEEISAITGLVFEMEGTTNEEPSDERPAFQPERYGDRWAPVLIAWSDSASYPRLEPPTLGVGGSTWMVLVGATPRVFVSGTVALNGDELAGYLLQPGGDRYVKAVILHELGHLLGLDHVNDPTQIMHDALLPDHAELGDGDIEGLRHLGRGECVPDL